MAVLQSVRLGVVSGLIIALGSGARAGAAEIRVEGPRSCSRASELQVRVARALGRSLTELDRLGDVRCRVHVVRDGGSYAARVEVSSPEQPRALQSFSAKTCPKLMDTLELALVLAVGGHGSASAGDAPYRSASADGVGQPSTLGSLPAARARSAGVTLSSASDASLAADASPLAKEAPIAKTPLAFAVPATPATSVERAPVVAPSGAGATSGTLAIANRASSATPSSEVGGDKSTDIDGDGPSGEAALWRAFGGVVLDSGSLPAPALGAQLGGSWGSDLELRALGTYLLPSDATFGGSRADARPYRVDFTLATAALLGCAPRLVRPGNVELGLCAGGELGALWSRSDLPRGASTRTPWSALRADVGARWELAPSGLSLEARLGLSVPLSRPRFTVSAIDESDSELGDIYRPSAIGGRLSVTASFALDGAP